MQKWEYLWMYAASEKGTQVFFANGQRLEAQSYPEALNGLGRVGWELVSVIPAGVKLPIPIESSPPQFCFKRPIPD